MTSPLVFSFDANPNLSPGEIEKLWTDAQLAQKAIDRFLSGEFTEQEMTDLLSLCNVDIDETRDRLDENAQILGMIPY